MEEEEVVAEERVSIDRVYLSSDSTLKNVDIMKLELDKEIDQSSSFEVTPYESGCCTIAINDRPSIHNGVFGDTHSIQMVFKCAQGESPVEGMNSPSNERTVNIHDDMFSFDNEINLFSAIEVIPSEVHNATCNEKSVINSEDSERKVLDTSIIFKGDQGNLMENIECLQAFESVCIVDIRGEVDAIDGQNISKNFIKKMESQFVNDSFFQVTGSNLSLVKDYRKPVEIIDEETVDETEFNIQPGYLCCVSSRKSSFFLDSGSKYHICRDRFCLQNFNKLPKNQFVELYSTDNNAFIAKHKGDIIYHNIKLHDVLFTSKAGFNVISVGKLDKEGLMICIGDGRFTVYCVEQSKLIGEGKLNEENNDYEFRSLDWCLSKKDRNQKALIDEHTSEDNEDEDWVIDCCCSRHMVGKLTILSEGVPESRKFTTATGTIETTMAGNVSTDSIFLSDVSYCPAINHNLMSVAQLDTRGFSFTFYKGRCVIQSRETLEQKGYGRLNPKNNRYLLKEFLDTKIPAKTKTQLPKKRKR